MEMVLGAAAREICVSKCRVLFFLSDEMLPCRQELYRVDVLNEHVVRCSALRVRGEQEAALLIVRGDTGFCGKGRRV